MTETSILVFMRTQNVPLSGVHFIPASAQVATRSEDPGPNSPNYTLRAKADVWSLKPIPLWKGRQLLENIVADVLFLTTVVSFLYINPFSWLAADDTTQIAREKVWRRGGGEREWGWVEQECVCGGGGGGGEP